MFGQWKITFCNHLFRKAKKTMTFWLPTQKGVVCVQKPCHKVFARDLGTQLIIDILKGIATQLIIHYFESDFL